LLLAAVFAAAVFFLRTAVIVEPDRVTFISPWSRQPLTVQRDQVKGVAARSVRPSPSTQPQDRLVVYGDEHRSIKVLMRVLWEDADLTRLRAELGRPGELSSTPRTRVQFEEEFPGALRSWERHPTAVGVALAFVLMLVLGLVIVAVPAFRDSVMSGR
jgi:hypothetical protein